MMTPIIIIMVVSSIAGGFTGIGAAGSDDVHRNTQLIHHRRNVCCVTQVTYWILTYFTIGQSIFMIRMFFY